MFELFDATTIRADLHQRWYDDNSIQLSITLTIQLYLGQVLISTFNTVANETNPSADEHDGTQGTWIANITFCCILGVATLIQLVVKEDLRRQRGNYYSIYRLKITT